MHPLVSTTVQLHSFSHYRDAPELSARLDKRRRSSCARLVSCVAARRGSTSRLRGLADVLRQCRPPAVPSAGLDCCPTTVVSLSRSRPAIQPVPTNDATSILSWRLHMKLKLGRQTSRSVSLCCPAPATPPFHIALQPAHSLLPGMPAAAFSASRARDHGTDRILVAGQERPRQVRIAATHRP